MKEGAEFRDLLGAAEVKFPIRNNENIIIEFQNSPISSSMIQQRESFYGEMVWVINAESFKGNFKLNSLVKKQLKTLNFNWSYQVENMEKDMKDDLQQKIQWLASQQLCIAQRMFIY